MLELIYGEFMYIKEDLNEVQCAHYSNLIVCFMEGRIADI